MMARIIKMAEVEPREIARRIRAGEVFIYPTDTVYGIGCDALDEDAVRRVCGIKGRGQGKPLSVAFRDVDQLLEFAEVGGEQRKDLERMLPGPYTFIVRSRGIPKPVTAGLDTVGARVPGYGPLRELIEAAGTPVVTTSANASGEAPTNRFDRISKGIVEKADFAIDAGECGSGKPSAVINMLTGKRLR